MPDGVTQQGWPESPETMTSVAWRLTTLLDAIPTSTNDKGWWIKNYPFRDQCLEVTASGTLAGTVTLTASNKPVMPPNGFVITITGSATTSDVLTIALQGGNIGNGQGFSNGQIIGEYTVKGGDNTTNIAAGLAAALTAALNQDISSPVVPPYVNIAEGYIPETVTPEQQNAAGFIQVATSTDTVTVTTQCPGQVFSVATTKNSGASETLAVTQYDSGDGFAVGSSTTVTSTGRVDFQTAAMWIKAPLSGHTTGVISATLMGVIP